MFEFAQLRCFVAAGEELHFGRAARRLNVTQPPLSRQIQALEHAVGAAPFERTSRTVRLTPAGRAFLPEARRLLRLAEGAALTARRVARGDAGSVTFGFTAGASYAFLPRPVAACAAAADRLGQHTVASKTDDSRLRQAQELFKLAQTHRHALPAKANMRRRR